MVSNAFDRSRNISIRISFNSILIYDSVYQFKRCIFSGMFRPKAILVRNEKTIFLKIR